MGSIHKITSQTQKRKQPDKDQPASILAIDIGGSKVKVLAAGQTEPRKTRSGKGLTPADMVEAVRELAQGWDYEAVSIGYPGMVGKHGPRSEPGNLGPGWVGFDFAAAFGLPVRIINDAAMQALGSYEGGRMLFLGLGTGLGSALIADSVIIPLELGQLLYNGEMLGDLLGAQSLKRLGQKSWSQVVERIVPMLMSALLADHVVLGGGNSKKLKQLPAGVRLGNNLTAFRGGFRLWHLKDVPTLLIDDHHFYANQAPVK
jgi:polyphosphate glucokinase